MCLALVVAMKKLICLLAVLAALMGILVIDLSREPSPLDDGSVELAKQVDTPSQPSARPPRSSGAAELQRVIRQGAE